MQKTRSRAARGPTSCGPKAHLRGWRGLTPRGLALGRLGSASEVKLRLPQEKFKPLARGSPHPPRKSSLRAAAGRFSYRPPPVGEDAKKLLGPAYRRCHNGDRWTAVISPSLPPRRPCPTGVPRCPSRTPSP